MKRICGAHCRTTGEPCRRPPLAGRTRCRIHGGTALTGAAHPNYRHGQDTRLALPAPLRDLALAGMADPELLSLREDIALWDRHLADLYAKLGTGESGAAWKGLREAADSYRKLAGSGTQLESDALAAVLTSIETGSDDSAVYEEIRIANEHRERLVASERRRQVELGQYILAKDAHVLLNRLADTVRRHVTDRDTLQAIAQEAQRLVSLPGRTQPVPAEQAR